MRAFRQSTVVTLSIGPALDSSGVEYTGLVIGDLTITKAGTSSAMAAAATLTHVANGHYSLVTIAGNTDTVGSLRIHCNKATYQIPPIEGHVVEEAIYDALFAASANAWSGAAGSSIGTANMTQIAGSAVNTAAAQLGVNVVNAGNVGWNSGSIQSSTFSDEAITAAKIANGAISAAKFGSGAIDAAALAPDAGTEIGTAVWASATRTLTAATNITSTGGTTVPQTGDSFARIGAAGAGLTDLGGMSTTMKAQVEQEATDALTATVADSIPADGTRPSVASACYMICQGLFEGSISGTTWTVKKVDGSTTLFTVTLDSTTPTSKTRAT